MYQTLKFLPTAVLAVVLLAAFAASSDSDESNMIVGGVRVNIEDVPYQAALFQKNMLICGGTIIGPQWIVTSYHCVERMKPEQYGFVVGTDVPANGELLKVKNVTLPKEITEEGNILHDIALVQLEQPLTFSDKVKCLPLLSSSDALTPGKPATISGFGTSHEGGFDSPLKAATIEVLPADTCKKAYPGIMQSFMICAGFVEGGVDSCQGDSGGPLVVDGQLAGVVFYGKGCGRANFPGVYISVPSFHDWIVQVVRSQKNPSEQKLCGEE
uniref:trypsin n=1 Tax=Anopheles culicifacies TaxID=139723 RepID=A0A182LZ76_9DIPT